MFVAMMQECIKVSHSGVTTSKECKSYIHDHPLYLICPDLPVVVGETSYGIRVGFIVSTL